jgi:membrane-bound lytic murein transglycosylase D
MVPQLESALRVVPADRRDSWRVHRIEPGDTFAAVAKRYGTTPDLLSSANHDQLPQAGMFAAVPVSFPGERVTVKAAPRNAVAKKASAKKAGGAKTASKTGAKPAARASGKTVRTAGKRTSGA